MLLSIRGTNGAGKSTIVRAFIERYSGKPLFGLLGPKRPEAYALCPIPGVTKPVYVLGSYHVESGGLDQVQPYDLVLDLIEKYAPKGHVLFEGVIVSSSYGRVGRLLERWGQDAVMGFLTTSLEECIERVKKRRATRGDNRPFDPTNLTGKFNSVAKSKIKIAAEDKVRVVDIDKYEGFLDVLKLLQEAA